jgi:arginyl-tRNA synthetase
MSVFDTYTRRVHGVLAEMVAAGELPELDFSRATVEPPRDPAHGDLATNAAMVLAKPAGMPPREIAEKLSARLGRLNVVTSVDIAGPGFINLRLADAVWQDELTDILKAGTTYGDGSRGKTAPPVNVEYVSANPTGPMHTAHARGAIVGDALASLLVKAGYKVNREYYLNDAGNQVNVLGRSTYLRYCEALGETIGEIPPGLYPGEYLKDVGAQLAERDGRKWLNALEPDWLPVMRDFAIDTIMEEIKTDLHTLGIHHDTFSSERKLIASGAVDRAIDRLTELGLIYEGVLDPPKGKAPDDWEPRPQMLFRSTDFGDDVDRPLKKSDGSYTYFASDIAYHYDKLMRGWPVLIDVVGADHGGWVRRMQAAVAAVSEGKAQLDIKLCQMVSVLDNGVPVKMSKRAGTFITLRDMMDRVGKDVLRFVMLTRRNDQTLEIDYSKALEQSKDNPVFYVQYAHARCCSVLRHAAIAFPGHAMDDAALAAVPLSRMTSTDELGMVRLLAQWPRLVELAAEAHEPHRVAFYLQEVAAAFHTLWTRGREDATLRFIHEDDAELTLQRLALIRGVALVIGSGLRVIGVTPLEELRS